MKTLPAFSNHMPGAVPMGFVIFVQQTGSAACCRLGSIISLPRLLKNAVISCSASSWISNLQSKYFANSGFVKSSLVGPSPPVIKIISARFSASAKAVRISSS